MSEITGTRPSGYKTSAKDDAERALFGELPDDPADGTVDIPLSERLRERLDQGRSRAHQAAPPPPPGDSAPPPPGDSAPPPPPPSALDNLKALAERASTITRAEVDTALTALLPDLAREPDDATVDCQIRGIGQEVRGFGVVAAAALRELAKLRKAVKRTRTATPRPADTGVAGEDERPRPAGLPEGWSDPGGWVCSTTGIWHQKDTPEGPVLARVTQRPLWIGRRWKDVDSGAWTVDVQWPGGSAIVGREVAMDSRGIIGLAGQGAPVGSSSARGAAQWLEISEQHNAGIVPVEVAISRLGWTETANGMRALQTPEGPHMLRTEGEGRSIASTIRRCGTFTDWQKAAKEVNCSPVAAIMLAASVASVMLEATGAANFILDLCGKSSRGKTTALRWAASAWGDPAENGGYLSKWNSTQVFIERKGAFLNGLPLCIDDTKQLSEKSREELKNIIYMWEGGQGRGRGSTTGTCETATWRSILLSTGESPLSVIGGHHEGMKLRVLTLNEMPFSEAKLCAPILNLEDYGHIGPMIAAWTVQNWADLKARWSRRRDKIRTELGGGDNLDRISGYVATLTLAGNALVTCGVPMPLTEMKDMLYKAAKSALTGSDIAGEAFQRIGEWLVQHPDRISGATARTEVPCAGWIGRVVDTGEVGVYPALLEKQIVQLGYVPDEVIPQWADRGFILTGRDVLKLNTWFDGKSPRMYRLKIEGWKVWRPELPPAPSDSDQR